MGEDEDLARTWSDNQRRAIEALDGDVCVSAGAGSGKTGVLVERFLRIVQESLAGAVPPERRAGVGEILVITFTEKATREMKGRIVERLTAAGLMQERRELETAYISTIHGFCSRLLKENPFEAGIDPEFTVLDESEARRLLRTEFENVVEAAFVEEDVHITELVAAAQNERVFGEDVGEPLAALGASVESALARIRGAGWRLSDLSTAIDDGEDPVAARSTRPLADILGPAVAEIHECLAELARPECVGLGVVESKRIAVLGLAASLAAPADRPTASGVSELVAGVEAIAKAAAGVRRPRQGATAREEAVITLLERIKRMGNRIFPFSGMDSEREAEAARFCYRFLRLTRAVWERYGEAKRVLGVLDNDDLQSEAVHLLRSTPAVLRRCRRTFRHIMVDEFQDTNPLQMRLIELLHGGNTSSERENGRVGEGATEAVGGVGGVARAGGVTAVLTPGILRPTPSQLAPDAQRPTPPTLFVVGDVQQSIYGFRNAAPGIFQGIERSFRAGAAGTHVLLSENYRSRPEILRFVNRVFREIWRGEQTSFTPLQAGISHTPKAEPSIECLIGRDSGREAYLESEASAIARRVKEIVDTRAITITQVGHPRCGEPVSYGDITVLLRVLTDVEKYERAFAGAAAPYFVVGGGRGYYARHEIRDVMNVLTVLDSPLDDIALAATLRSPMVGLATETLYALARFCRSGGGNRRAPMYPQIAAFLGQGQADGDEMSRLSAFYTLAERLREDEGRLPVGHLLERVIEATRYDARLLVRPNGRRRLANVRKLLQMAHSASIHGVGDFIRRLREIERVSEREGDAPTEEEFADVVRLMTIHKAKGLEFPVVFLADLGRNLLRPEQGVFVCDGTGLAIGCRMAEYESGPYRAIAALKREAEDAEANRLLYVALTRAREHLVLCSSTGGRSRGANWAERVLPNFGILAPPEEVQLRPWGDDDPMRVAPISAG